MIAAAAGIDTMSTPPVEFAAVGQQLVAVQS